MRTFKPFIEGDLDNVLRNCIEQIRQKVHTEKSDYLLNVDEAEYIEHLVSEFHIGPPQINAEAKFITQEERMIESERHPSDFFPDPGQSYKRQVITYHLPVTGDVNILNFKPNPFILWTTELIHETTSEGDFLLFDVVNFSNDTETIKRAEDEVIGTLTKQLVNTKNQIDGYNSSLHQEIERIVKERKKDLLAKGDFLSTLGVPIQKKGGVSDTFAVPSPKVPQKIVPRPVVTTSEKPDPTLNLDVYSNILKIIHDVGKAIERMPSTYEGKSEEALRDHLLMFLEPQFEGSTTGETFNKSGKTDILLRYQNSNVFIAECKYWSGETKYLETIDQILSYLTWRDSKAAIVLFVRNKDFSTVIETVKTTTPKHFNYLRFDGEKENTWLSYRVHLNEDKNREVYLTVLLFHFPDVK